MKALFLWNHKLIFKTSMKKFLNFNAQSDSYLFKEYVRFWNDETVLTRDHFEMLMPSEVRFEYREEEERKVTFKDAMPSTQCIDHLLMSAVTLGKEVHCVVLLYVSDSNGKSSQPFTGMYEIVHQELQDGMITSNLKLMKILHRHCASEYEIKRGVTVYQSPASLKLKYCNDVYEDLLAIQVSCLLIHADLSLKGLQIRWKAQRNDAATAAANSGLPTEADIILTTQKSFDLNDCSSADILIHHSPPLRYFLFDAMDDHDKIDSTSMGVRLIRWAQYVGVFKFFHDPHEINMRDPKEAVDDEFVWKLSADDKKLSWQSLPLNDNLRMGMKRPANIVSDDDELHGEVSDANLPAFKMTNLDIQVDPSITDLTEKSFLGSCVRPRNIADDDDEFYAVALSNIIPFGMPRNSAKFVTFLPEGSVWISMIMVCVGVDIPVRHELPSDLGYKARNLRDSLQHAIRNCKFVVAKDLRGQFELLLQSFNSDYVNRQLGKRSDYFTSNSIFSHGGLLSNLCCNICKEVFPTATECCNHIDNHHPHGVVHNVLDRLHTPTPRYFAYAIIQRLQLAAPGLPIYELLHEILSGNATIDPIRVGQQKDEKFFFCCDLYETFYGVINDGPVAIKGNTCFFCNQNFRNKGGLAYHECYSREWTLSTRKVFLHAFVSNLRDDMKTEKRHKIIAYDKFPSTEVKAMLQLIPANTQPLLPNRSSVSQDARHMASGRPAGRFHQDARTMQRGHNYNDGQTISRSSDAPMLSNQTSFAPRGGISRGGGSRTAVRRPGRGRHDTEGRMHTGRATNSSGALRGDPYRGGRAHDAESSWRRTNG